MYCDASIVITVFNSCPLSFCFTSCVVMLTFWSPSTAAHFAFWFTVVLRVVSGPRVKLAGRKSALTLPPPPPPHSPLPRWFTLLTFRTFVRFVLVWICRFPLPLGVWEGLRFVIVALPGLFSYLFLFFVFCCFFF